MQNVVRQFAKLLYRVPNSSPITPIPGGQDKVIEWFDSTVVPFRQRESESIRNGKDVKT